MDFHVSTIGFFIFTAYLLIAGFFLRWLSARYSDTTWGKALGYIY